MTYHYGIDPRKRPEFSYSSFAVQNPSRQKANHDLNFQNAYNYNRAYSKITNSSPPPLGKLNVPLDEGAISCLFDDLMIIANRSPINDAIESSVTQLFHAAQTFIWFLNDSTNQLYSLTKSKSFPKDQGILGSSYSSQKVIHSQTPSRHPRFDLNIDSYISSMKPNPTNSRSNSADSNSIGNFSELLIPLHHFDDSPFGVLQIFRSEPFNDNEILISDVIIRKFSIYSCTLFKNLTLPTVINEIIPTSTTTPLDFSFVPTFLNKIQSILHSRSVELWQHTVQPMLFDSQNLTFLPISKAGVVSKVFLFRVPISIQNVLTDQYYNSKIDGIQPEGVLLEPIDEKYAILVRSPNNLGIAEQQKLHSLCSLLVSFFNSFSSANSSSCSSQNFEVMKTSHSFRGNAFNFAERLKALLEVAEYLSGVLDIDNLIPAIMEKSCQLLNTERCSLFLVDDNHQELVTRFHGGLDKSIRMPRDKGIVGVTATTGKVVNIPDAYADPRFDQNIDKATGFHTRNLLTVPIYNNRGEIAGVTEMINKLGKTSFDEDDIKMMMAFNVFCGISLDNAKLYQASLDLTRQLRGFVEMSSALNKTKTVRDVIEEILTNAQGVIHANRATVFVNEDEELSHYVSIGESSQYGMMFANNCIKTRTAKVFNSEEIALLLDNDSSNNNTKLTKTPSVSNSQKLDSTSRISSALESDPNIMSEGNEEKQLNIAVFPLLMNDNRLLGVMEMSAKGKILPEDMKLLDCFAVFAAVSLERSELQEVAKVGFVETQLKKYLTPKERDSYEVPEKLLITEKKDGEKANSIPKINFDAVAWDGIGHFKVLFNIFSIFSLLKEFKIKNEMFFKFLSEVSSTYNKVPYHNWRHAVDVTEFVTYELKLAQFDERLSKFELLGLLVSSICHDANHDGFTNVFNEKAETPLGILFKNQSVMETHHCSVTIGIISKNEMNLFHTLGPVEYKQMWNLIIQLILMTDMAKHFNFLKDVNSKFDEKPFTFEEFPERLMAMQLVLKCGDVSNVSRPFELADKWCDVLCEEFFRQGDLEMASGMEYTSPLNDRAHLDKPKSQIGFYNFVCLPLYVTAAKVLKPLQANVDQVQSNLAVWKAANDAKALEEQKAAA